MNRFIVSVLLQFCILYLFTESAILNTIRPRKIECTPNPKFLVNVSCVIKVIGREKYTLNMDVDLERPVKNVTITGQVFVFRNGYRPFLNSLTLNACALMSRKVFHPVTNIALKIASKISNINHTCPYSGHLFVRNAQYVPGMIDVLVPQGKYKVYMKATEGYPPELIGTLHGFVDVEEREF